MKRQLIYDAHVDYDENSGQFRITWRDIETGTEDSFLEAFPNELSSILGLWRLSIYQKKIGEILFAFLNGNYNCFKKALEKADRLGTTLRVQLIACKEVIDWPFECLVQNGEFLLPRSLHLVRQVSQNHKIKENSPSNRVLKLLFMACSPFGVDPELDFDREEETIFQITNNLSIEVDIEDSGSITGLRNRLRAEKYDVIHLSGIAGIDKDQTPYFVMEDEFGYENRVSPGHLWEEALIENPPNLLFLSGSNTATPPGNGIANGENSVEPDGAFARLMAKEGRIPAVLGWGHLVVDAPAILATKILLKELSRGRSILNAVQRTRFELLKHFSGPGTGSWSFLRLYGDGNAMNALVKSIPKWKPNLRRMKHVYLKNSWVKVLSEGFVGRRRPIQQSLRILKKDKSKVGLLITGGGGLGKSCLAGKISERFPDHTLIIIYGLLDSFSMANALKTAFLVSQDEAAIHILELPLKTIEKLPELCLSVFKKRKYLFLFDDFEQNMENANEGQPGDLFPEAKDLLACLLQNLPHTGKETQLIITSRYNVSLPSPQGDLGEIFLGKMTLPAFTASENRKKVNVLDNLSNNENQDIVSFVVDLGGGNPRLLEWLDKWVGIEKKDEITNLFQDLVNKKEEFIEAHVLRELISYGGQELEFFLRGIGIFRRPVSIEGIKQIAGGCGLNSWEVLLEKGIGLSLIEHDQSSQRYMVSLLVQDILLPEDGDYSMFHQSAFDYYLELCDGKEMLDVSLAEEWVYHALGCGREDIATLHGARLVACLHRLSSIRIAFNIGEWILSSKKIKSRTSNDAFLFNEVAVSAFSIGEFKKAVYYYREAYSIDSECYGDEHPETALDLCNLGLALSEIKEYKEAKFCFYKVLDIYKKLYGPIHESVGKTLNNLGSVYFLQANYRKALELFEYALANDLEVFGEQDPQVAISLNNVGEALKRLDLFEKAIEYSLMALSINRNSFGEDHPSVARDLTNIGTAYFSLGQYSTSVEYLNQGYIIFRKLFGRYHSNLCPSLNSLGLAMIELKETDEAIKYFEEALYIQVKVNGADHPQTGAIMNNLGEAWRIKKNYPKAQKLFKCALKIARDAYGEKHPDVAVSNHSIGLIYYDQNDWEKAIHFLELSLSISTSVFGEEHTSVATDYYCLGQVYEEMGDLERAKTYFGKSYTIFSKYLPAENKWVKLSFKKSQVK